MDEPLAALQKVIDKQAFRIEWAERTIRDVSRENARLRELLAKLQAELKSAGL